MRNSEVIGMLSHESKEYRPDASESLAATQLSVLTGWKKMVAFQNRAASAN